MTKTIFGKSNKIILIGVLSVAAVFTVSLFMNGGNDNTLVTNVGNEHRPESISSVQPKSAVAPVKALATEDLTARHRTVVVPCKRHSNHIIVQRFSPKGSDYQQQSEPNNATTQG